MEHPPYSPNLVLSDFHLFPQLKRHLGGQKFKTDNDVKEAVGQFLEKRNANFYTTGIKRLHPRCTKCVTILKNKYFYMLKKTFCLDFLLYYMSGHELFNHLSYVSVLISSSCESTWLLLFFFT